MIALAVGLVLATASSVESTGDKQCKPGAGIPVAVVVDADGDAARLAVDAIYTHLQDHCMKLMPPALGIVDPVDAAKAVRAVASLRLHVTVKPGPVATSGAMHNFTLHVEARVVSTQDRSLAGVVDSSRNIIGTSATNAVQSFLDVTAVDNVIAPSADQIAVLVTTKVLSSSSADSAPCPAPKPGMSAGDLCAKLKTLPLKLATWGGTRNTGLETAHVDDLLARCAPNGNAYSFTLNINAYPDKADLKASASAHGELVETKLGTSIASISESLSAPLTQEGFDAMVDSALWKLIDAVEQDERAAPDDVKCKALGKAPIVVLPDSDSDAARIAFSAVIERLQKRCMKLFQPIAGGSSDPVEAARAVGATHALQLHIGIKQSDKSNALIEGTKMISYSISLEARIVSASDHALLGDIVHSAQVLGISPENAIKALQSRSYNDRLLAPTADDIVDRFFYGLTTTSR